MNRLFEIQKKLMPDILDKMYRRFMILSSIHTHQPIGRRNLSEYVDLTERVLRTEVDSLKTFQLIQIDKKGMTVTEDGIQVLNEMKQYMDTYIETKRLAQDIKSFYGIKDVIVVKGNSEKDPLVKIALGETTSQYLQNIVKHDCFITVTGGSTMASVANELKPFKHHVTFTPARGGLGEDVVYQANAIVSTMAKRSNSTFQTLYVPDQVSESAYQMLLNEPSVHKSLNDIKQADIVIHGIGEAIKMANRRHSDDTLINTLTYQHAEGEAFGYYFNQKGEIVYKVRTIGLQLDDLESKEHIIAVAGGKTKSRAIASYLNIAPKQTVLITDEVAAKDIVSLLQLQKEKSE